MRLWFNQSGTPAGCPRKVPVVAGHDRLVWRCGRRRLNGKTWALLFGALRHIQVPGYGAVIFRRTNPEITNEGGPWDEASSLYPHVGGQAKEHKLEFRFEPRARISFRNLEHQKDVTKWQGAQIPYVGIDEVTTFTEKQFWYLVSRNRSPCGTPTYFRATCNPTPADDPIGGWVNELVSWWIDPDTGYPIPERSGIVRWLVRVDNAINWFDSREQATEFALQHMKPDDAKEAPKSFTFIPATLDDNAILQAKDPSYRGSLLALPFVERERLLGGNWKIRHESGTTFQREWFDPATRPEMFANLDDVKPYFTKMVAYIDKAATEGGKGARTAIVLMARASNGFFYVVNCRFGRWSAHEREKRVREFAEEATAQFEENHIAFYIERENNSGGKVDGMWSVSNLAGFDVHLDSPVADKVTRANPVSAQCEAKTLRLVKGEWNKAWIDEHVAFPDQRLKDIVDATSGAFAKLIGRSGPPRLTRPLLVGVDDTGAELEDDGESKPLPVSWHGLESVEPSFEDDYLLSRWRW